MHAGVSPGWRAIQVYEGPDAIGKHLKIYTCLCGVPDFSIATAMRVIVAV